jgi:FKBP-type peptidyl-prolyl cis-trans isomerase (trigger factor)
MNDMLKQIIDMDERARQITDAAQQEKMNTEKEISQKREDIRTRYLERARARIEKNRPLEQAAAEKGWQIKERRYEELSKKMDQIYTESGEKWVDTIVRNVIGE